jgi:hypothetical protein
LIGDRGARPVANGEGGSMSKRMLLLSAVLFLVTVATHSAFAQDQVAFDATHSVRDNLKALQAAGKAVELVLNNGKSYGGKLASVGDNAVVVTEISGREFYDALIVIDEIAAVELRVRGGR